VSSFARSISFLVAFVNPRQQENNTRDKSGHSQYCNCSCYSFCFKRRKSNEPAKAGAFPKDCLPKIV